MQSWFPLKDKRSPITADKCTVFEGFSDLFDEFAPWLVTLAPATHSEIHGHLFAQESAEVSGHNAISHGCLSSSASLRGNNPTAFLTNLIWNAHGQHQCFRFCPRDVQKIGLTFHQEVSAQIFIITRAWLVPLSRSGRSPSQVYAEAMRLQAIEWARLSVLHVRSRKASAQIWSLADVVANPQAAMAPVIRQMAPNLTSDPTMPPVLMASNVLATVLKELKDQGMHPVPTRLIYGQISTKQRWPSGNAPIVGTAALQSSGILWHERTGFTG